MRRERDLPFTGLCARMSSGVRFMLIKYTKLALLGLVKQLIFTFSIFSNSNYTGNCVEAVVTSSLKSIYYFILKLFRNTKGYNFLSTVSLLFILAFGLMHLKHAVTITRVCLI